MKDTVVSYTFLNADTANPYTFSRESIHIFEGQYRDSIHVFTGQPAEIIAEIVDCNLFYINS